MNRREERDVTTTTPARRVGWRQRWAVQENRRRQEGHAVALAGWQRQDVAARRLVDAARNARPDPPGAGPGSLRLSRAEAVYWTGTGALIEPAYEPALRPPDHPDIDFGPAPGAAATGMGVSARQTDTGAVTVTSKRVVFVGRSRREWAFGKLTGVAHTASGQTLMRVGNRVRVSGLVFAPDVVPGFRFHLAVARADAAGDRAGLIARLEAEVDRHQALRPPPPAPAAAESAPVSAWFGPGVLTTIAASAVLLVGLCCVGTVMSADNNEASLSTPDAGVPASTGAPAGPPAPPARPSRAAPSPEATPAEDGAEAEAAVAAAADGDAGAAADAPAGDCAAYADSDGWCVDGIGDYDCAGGSGNGPNYAPEGVRVVEPGRDPFGLDRDEDGIGCDPYRAPAPPPPPADPPPPPPPASTDPRFGTCAEAKAAGYGPYHAGQTEYGWYRDADSDGVVCE
jgi:hypothetical protein